MMPPSMRREALGEDAKVKMDPAIEAAMALANGSGKACGSACQKTKHCYDLKKYPTFAERAVCIDEAGRWKPPPCAFTTKLYIRLADMDLDPAFKLKSFEKRQAIKMKILVKAVKSHQAAADLNKNGKIEPTELKHLVDKLTPMINDNAQLGKCTYTPKASPSKK